MIDDSLAVLRDYQRLGVATSALPQREHEQRFPGRHAQTQRLTDFGKDVVRELNRLWHARDIALFR
jgi:microsomal dipeptidase-like Zn-dependent dipeptidase